MVAKLAGYLVEYSDDEKVEYSALAWVGLKVYSLAERMADLLAGWKV